MEPSTGPTLVVGIGASAGGLDAFKAFFTNMPPDSGMAFVLVQHLAPDHKSLLADLIGRTTAMTVAEAEDTTRIAANCVYVIPPDATLTIKDAALHVTKPAPARENRRPIDAFFSSLAEDQGENAVCIVLSGTGSDGAVGLTAIKEYGGLTMAQAGFDHIAMSGMPHNAAATGLVDHISQVEDMPAKLVEYQRHLAHVAGRKEADGTRGDAATHLTAISTLLRTKLGHDFSQYKEKTFVRRIQRRMQVLQIDTVPLYVARLKEEPAEIELLFRELLIGVTQFFRDPDAFETLRTTVIPKLLEHKRADDPVRIWIPACATGQEVYSIAILVREAIERQGTPLNVQIFGTDIDDNAVATARAARYRKPMAGLSAEQIERWFAEEGSAYCPIKAIREMCVFSTHSVIKDPPFSKLDLISCRNLLIYLDADLQDRVIQTFHYALRPGGALFLGSSESVTRNAKLFVPLDKKHRIFRRSDAEMVLPALSASVPATQKQVSSAARTGPSGDDRLDKYARRTLEKYSPVYVIIDQHHEIVRFSGGEIGLYLGPSEGAASLNLFDILRKPLRTVARAAVQTASKAKEPIIHKDVALRIDGKSRTVTVIVAPVIEPGAEAGLCVVAFQDTGLLSARKAAKSGESSADASAKSLEQELQTTKTQLQAAIDEYEIVNEEMKSANEEYQSVNEELQSSNEELETSKEEMQSVNEELQTINAEMTSKNDQLTRLNSDLRNLFESTEIATIFLDNDLRIKSFTPGMTDIFRLLEADRGRPITDIVTLLNYGELQRDVKTVLRKLAIVEKEVQIVESGATFIMRIRPYRSVNNVIEGAVITFVNINDRKQAEAARVRLAAIVESTDDAIISKDLNGVILSWNAAAERLFGYTNQEAIGQNIAMLMPPDRVDEEPDILRRIRRGERVEHYETVRRCKDGSSVDVSLTISPILNSQGNIVGASKIARDIRDRKRADRALHENQARLQFTLDSAQLGDWDLNLIDDTSRRSPRHDKAFGYDEPIADWGFKKFIQHVHPEDRPAIERRFGDAIAQQTDWHFECRVIWPDGSVHWIEAHGSHYSANDGKPTHMLGVVSNIDERKQAEMDTALLMGELDHRVKNILAIVSSVIMQTLKTSASPGAFAASMEGRIAAIARAHSLLTEKGGKTEASLRAFIETELKPYDHGANVVISGAPVALMPKLGLAMAMAIHELASNAAKYGGLSTPSGRLAVTWQISGSGDNRSLKLIWEESGGPAVEQPSRRGFGTTLIEKTLQHEFDATVHREFKPIGLRCTIEIPLTVEAGHVANAREGGVQ